MVKWLLCYADRLAVLLQYCFPLGNSYSEREGIPVLVYILWQA